MRSTFNILFYVNKSKEKNGVVPVMGRVTINGTQSQFSCKKSIPLDMWDVKGNCAPAGEEIIKCQFHAQRAQCRKHCGLSYTTKRSLLARSSNVVQKGRNPLYFPLDS